MGILIFPLSGLLFLCLLQRHTGEMGRPICQQCNKNFFCDCSAENLHQIPSVPVDTLGFNLSFNHIENIAEPDLQEYGQLKILYLQNNWIKSIHQGAFASLRNLEILDLSYNRLTDLYSSWFDQLLSLTHLNLLGNDYRMLGSGFLFQQLSRLRCLRFGNPSFYTMNKMDLAGLGELDEMVIHGSNLKQYEEGSLGRIKADGALTLSLHGPFQRDPALVSKILRDLSSPQTLLVFADATINDNRSTQPFIEARWKGVTRIMLRNCSLTDEAIINFIKSMDNAPLSFLGGEDCQFSGHGFWDKVNATRHDNLETLFLKNIAIQDFYAFSSLVYLENVLKFPKNVSVINCEVFLMPCPTSKHLKKVEYLDFSENLLTDLAMRESLCNGNGTLLQLRSLNVSKNSLKSLELMSQLVTNLKKLVSLDLSQNAFSVMPPACTWPTSLQYLNLSKTQLRKITACLPKSLQVLDLSNNDLSVFGIKLPNLKELHISGNKFLTLPPGRWLESLEILLIQRNTLNFFGATDLKEYKNLKSLEAGYNKFVCSCEFVDFIQWKVGQIVRLGDGPESYMCDSPVALRGQQIMDVHLSVFECHMVVAVSILCTIVFLAIIIGGIICYKLHVVWYVKMTWAWLKAKRKRTVNTDNGVCYDAFVSYSERDSEWVEEFLVPELEGAQPPLRLCLHKRDFLPGGWIVDNIINAMEKSRRTLFILSRHFVSSEWCRYELDFSHFRLFDENNDTAVLILLEPIDKETIPKRFCKLRRFMNSRTYLEWPEDEAQRPLFWHNLKIAIKRLDC